MRADAVLGAIMAGMVAVASAAAQPPVRADGVTVTFLANEGVLLAANGRRVLIDGLFVRYETGFAVPADSTQAALRQARAPFDAVDLVLVTHRHGDHFHPAPVAAHLRANPRATLVTSRQVIDSLRAGAPSDAAALAPRLVARTMAPGTRRREVVGGVAVELLGLPHGGWRHRRVEHLAFVVELGGRRVLHVGDADLTDDMLATFRLDTARIDVALVPAWAVTDDDARRAIARWIRPRHVVAFHVGADDGGRPPRAVRAALPGALTFARSLDARRF